MVRRVDPWSVLKFAVVLAVVLFVVALVVVVVLFLILSAAGVFDKADTLIGAIFPQSKGTIFTAKNVIGVTAVVGAVEAGLFVVLSTLGAFAYNLCADLVGGIEVTLSERD